MSPLLLLGGGAVIGAKWGHSIYTSVRDFVTGKAAPKYDANLPAALRRDLDNLIENVKNPILLDTASAYYQAAGYPLAARALAEKAATVK
jgi:hypothetical protein